MHHFSKKFLNRYFLLGLVLLLTACQSGNSSETESGSSGDTTRTVSGANLPDAEENEAQAEPVPIECPTEGEVIELDFDPTKNPETVLINGVELNFAGSVSLSKTNEPAFVAYDPAATGTSGEDFFEFFVSCGEGKWVKVLSEYGRKFFVLDFLPEGGWYTVAMTTNADLFEDGMPIYRDGFSGYIFNGSEYVQLKAEIWMANGELIIRDAAKSDPPRFESNEAEFGARLVPTTAEELRISLDNGQYFAYPTQAKGPEEKQVNAFFYRFYPEANAVVYRIERYEEMAWLWVELASGNSMEFKGEPILSPAGNRILAFSGNLDQPEFTRKLVFAQRASGEVSLQSSFTLPEASDFVLERLHWTSEKRLAGVVHQLNDKGNLIESPVEIRVR